MKKIISLFLSLAMLLSIVSVVDFSAYADTYGDFECYINYYNKTACITKYVGSATMLEIPSTINGYTLTSIGSFSFYNCASLTSVTVPNSITSVNDNAFEGCTNLTTISIPNSITEIDDSAFENCSNLYVVRYGGTKSQWNSISIREDNSYLTRSIIICTDGVFTYYSTVEIDNLIYKINDDLTATVVGYKGDIKEIIIPSTIQFEGYTFNVTRIGEDAFYKCASLTNITIPNSVTRIDRSAFYDCTSLSSVAIPDSVTSIGENVFCNCTSLTNITIPNSVTSIYASAFSDCTSLKSVTMSQGVNYICDFIFYNCISLTSVTIPDGVTGIGDSAFSNCASLTSITMPNSVTNIGNNAFFGCISLMNITISSSVNKINDYAFYNCSNLTNINYNGTREMWNAIVIGKNNDILSKKNIHCVDGGVFSNSDSVTIDGLIYTLNNDNTATIIGHSGKPQNIIIPETITYYGFSLKVTSISSSAFYKCESLKCITIKKNIENIDYGAFSGCSNLKDIYFDGKKSEFNKFKNIYDDSRNILCHYTDEINKKITKNNCVYLIKNYREATVFGYTGKPKTMKIRSKITYNGVKVPVKSIYYYAFKNCKSLNSVYIPDSIEAIGSEAFKNCKMTGKVVLSKKIKAIEDDAFSGNSFNLYFDGTLSDWVKINDWDASKYFGRKYSVSWPSLGAKHIYMNGKLVKKIVITDSMAKSYGGVISGPFVHFKDLETIVFSDKIVGVRRFDFFDCNKIKTVKFGSGLEYVENWSFPINSNIKDVYYNGTLKEWRKVTKAQYDESRIWKTARIHFKKSSAKKKYKTNNKKKTKNIKKNK